MNIYVPAIGNPNAKLMLLGEAPAIEEERALKPFVGASGRELDKILREVGINRSELWISNVSKFAVPALEKGKKIPFHIRCQQAGIDLDQQLSDLRNEIHSINPNCILALGGTALWSLTGFKKITDYRGSILLGMGKKCIATYHPAHLLHSEGAETTDYYNRQIMLFDFKRAKAQSAFPEINRPSRNLQICKNSAQLYDFIQRHRTFNSIAVDIEAHDCIPICIGLAFTRSEGITLPLWNDKGQISSDHISSWRLIANLLYNSKINKIGQNFKYDQDKITRLGLPIDKLYSDTMLKAFTINPELPKNLAFNTSIYTEEPFYKNEGMYEGSTDDLFIGCARDSCVTKEIDEEMEKDIVEMELSDWYYNFVMKLHDLYLHIENNGFNIDYEKRESLLRKYIEWDERINYELFQIVRAPINTSSPKQVASLLYENLKIPTRKGTGEEVLTQLLNNVVRDPLRRKVIELILEDRRVKKTISTYLTALPDYDGKMKTTYFICLETGRTSTGQQDPPIRPLLEYRDEERKKKKKPLGIAFQTISKHGDLGPDVRAQYICDPDTIFIQADSSQAEARIIFLLAEDEDALRDIDIHDYHALTASWFFGGAEKDYSKKELGYESPIRFAGKTIRHAGHLGASKRRAAIELNTQARKYKIDFTISEAEADRALKIFHSKQPRIKEVFQKEIRKCIEKDRTLIAPVPYGIQSRIGGKRIFYERFGEELFRQAFSYIPQRAVSDNTKAAALRIRSRAEWIKIIVEAHDALLVQVPISRTNEAGLILKEEFERPIRFDTCSLPRRDLTIPAELEVGTNYYELSKFKMELA